LFSRLASAVEARSARLGKLRCKTIFAVELQEANERSERQTLDNEGRKHNRKGGEHDQIALREVAGEREGGCQRHQPAHPAPANQYALAQCWWRDIAAK
jgi:hypothetical protein